MSHATIMSSIYWAIGMTLLTSILDVKYRAKSKLRATFTSSLGLFVLLQLIGNTIATSFAAYLIVDKLPSELLWFSPLIFAFTGIFAFEGVLSNTNLNIFDNKVLKFEEWVGWARDPAVSDARKKDTQLTVSSQTALAMSLKNTCPITDIDTYLEGKLTAAKWQAIKQKSSRIADGPLYKCTLMAEQHEDKANALAKTYRKKSNNNLAVASPTPQD